MSDTELTTGSGPSGGIEKPLGDVFAPPAEFTLPVAPELSLPQSDDTDTSSVPSDVIPNVVLAPSKEDEALAEGHLTIGRTRIMMPDKETQLSGFYTEHAGTLVAQYRQYKFSKPNKGKAHNSTVKLD